MSNFVYHAYVDDNEGIPEIFTNIRDAINFASYITKTDDTDHRLSNEVLYVFEMYGVNQIWLRKNTASHGGRDCAIYKVTSDQNETKIFELAPAEYRKGRSLMCPHCENMLVGEYHSFCFSCGAKVVKDED